MDTALNDDGTLFPGLSSFLPTRVNDQFNLENAWWMAFRNGSRSALNAIFDKYARAMHSYGSSLTKDLALVEDCIQDVFFELWTKREAVASEVNYIKPYLLKSLRRRVLRRLSADKRSLGDKNVPEDYDDEVVFSIEFTIVQAQISHDLKQHLIKAVSELSKRQKEAVYLKFYENISYEEMAIVMDIDLKAAYNLIGKSILLLRKTLKSSSIHG